MPPHKACPTVFPVMNDNDERNDSDLTMGAALIRENARSLPDSPGVYRMVDAQGTPLYVGKARSLKKRVASYANVGKLPVRLQRMVAATHGMAFVHTHTEAEALLLESNLIKTLKPRYNVLLRDDKSFPYILLTGDHDFPLLTKHRGARSREGDYFGPFAAASAVNETIATLQKAFMLRNCSDNVFGQRTRPCLQYHIKRCTAPCVGYVSKEEYAAQVADARAFLSGKSREVQNRLLKQMHDASARQDYEAASILRDRIRALTAVQGHQNVNVEGLGDADIVALHRDGGRSCVQVFFFRGGQNFGNRSYFPRHSDEEDEAEIMAAFMAQFYENKPVPPMILLSHEPQERELIAEALSSRRGEGAVKVQIVCPQRGSKRRLIDFAMKNAEEALRLEDIKQAQDKENLEALAALCGLEEPVERVEVYDNSHISGTNMTGVMIVAGPEGLRKNAYRKFNIHSSGAGDDYGMMREVMQRRFKGGLAADGAASDRPDLLLIDGGQGQLNTVQTVLDDLGIGDAVTVLSIAKGPDRNAGRETFYMTDRASFTLTPGDPLLHYLQRLRDEAHRFAIGAHRARRSKQMASSPLDEVPGIGAARKKALLAHFGSGQAVSRAGLADLEQVEGISRALAQKIYDHFHGGA